MDREHAPGQLFCNAPQNQNEKLVETDMDIWYEIYKKQLLESERNSAM